MDNPEVFPESILRSARAVADVFYKTDTGHKRNLIRHIARAIFAERQVCIDVAGYIASEGGGADHVYFALAEDTP